jgi:hypothetical protein
MGDNLTGHGKGKPEVAPGHVPAAPAMGADKKTHTADADRRPHTPDADKKPHTSDVDKRPHTPDADKRTHAAGADKKAHEAASEVKGGAEAPLSKEAQLAKDKAYEAEGKIQRESHR